MELSKNYTIAFSYTTRYNYDVPYKKLVVPYTKLNISYTQRYIKLDVSYLKIKIL